MNYSNLYNINKKKYEFIKLKGGSAKEEKNITFLESIKNIFSYILSFFRWIYSK
jgi:hypothetical protein